MKIHILGRNALNCALYLELNVFLIFIINFCAFLKKINLDQYFHLKNLDKVYPLL